MRERRGFGVPAVGLLDFLCGCRYGIFVADIELEELGGAGQVSGVEVFQGCFAFGCRAAAEDDVLGDVFHEQRCEAEADA